MMIVIPARLASSRLPEKLLLRAGGKSVLQHTHEAAAKSHLVARGGRIIVAVDDDRLAEEVRAFGGEARMTSSDCPSGTDRIAEIALAFPDVDVFVNVQGDEPEIDPATIDGVADLLAARVDADIATAMTPIRDAATLADPNCVKVLMGASDLAITFSRAAIPHVRGGVTEAALHAQPPLFWHHIGLYAYRRDFLLWFASQPPGRLEDAEKLEQMRAIEAGRRIVATAIAASAAGIDTPADFEAFAARVSSTASVET